MNERSQIQRSPLYIRLRVTRRANPFARQGVWRGEGRGGGSRLWAHRWCINPSPNADMWQSILINIYFLPRWFVTINSTLLIGSDRNSLGHPTLWLFNLDLYNSINAIENNSTQLIYIFHLNATQVLTLLNATHKTYTTWLAQHSVLLIKLTWLVKLFSHDGASPDVLV